MAAGLYSAITPKPFRSFQSSHHTPKPTPVFHPLLRLRKTSYGARRTNFAICFVLEEQKQSAPQIPNLVEEGRPDDVKDPQILIPARMAEKLARKKSERFTYLIAAVMSSLGITSMAVMAVYYRFSWQMEVCFSPFPSLFFFSIARSKSEIGLFFFLFKF